MGLGHVELEPLRWSPAGWSRWSLGGSQQGRPDLLLVSRGTGTSCLQPGGDGEALTCWNYSRQLRSRRLPAVAGLPPPIAASAAPLPAAAVAAAHGQSMGETGAGMGDAGGAVGFVEF